MKKKDESARCCITDLTPSRFLSDRQSGNATPLGIWDSRFSFLMSVLQTASLSDNAHMQIVLQVPIKDMKYNPWFFFTELLMSQDTKKELWSADKSKERESGTERRKIKVKRAEKRWKKGSYVHWVSRASTFVGITGKKEKKKKALINSYPS